MVEFLFLCACSATVVWRQMEQACDDGSQPRCLVYEPKHRPHQSDSMRFDPDVVKRPLPIRLARRPAGAT